MTGLILTVTAIPWLNFISKISVVVLEFFQVDLFAMDLIMIPIHLGMHWCLAAIDVRAKTITYYDSLLGDNHQCTNALK